MLKKIFFILILINCESFISDDITLLKKINITASYITSDNIGCLYIITGSNLFKYDSNGNLLKTYSDKSHGDISFVDASNPLNVLLYYRDFRVISFLENMLSPNGDFILLDELGIMQPILVCSSYENGFWVYDQQNFQLTRFNKNLQITNKSGNIVQLTGMNIEPNFLIEAGNMVYMNDTVHGILVFDKYGTYAKTVSFKNLNFFQILDDNIVYTQNSQMNKYNLKTYEQKIFNLPLKNITSSRIEKGRMFLMDSTSVYIYSIP